MSSKIKRAIFTLDRRQPGLTSLGLICKPVAQPNRDHPQPQSPAPASDSSRKLRRGNAALMANLLLVNKLPFCENTFNSVGSHSPGEFLSSYWHKAVVKQILRNFRRDLHETFVREPKNRCLRPRLEISVPLGKFSPCSKDPTEKDLPFTRQGNFPAGSRKSTLASRQPTSP